MNLIGHIQGNGMQALVRVSKNEEVAIKRVLDAGADGVIVPMIRNKEEAKQAVDYVKYPPIGKRGVGLNRAQKYGTAFDTYKEWVKDEVVVIAQIEHIDAVNNIEEILSVPGIDGTYIGPYDLSMSLGIPGQLNHPDVIKAKNKVLEATLKKGLVAGIHCVHSDTAYTDSKLAIQQGYRFIAIGTDILFLGNSARSVYTEIQKNIL